MLAAAEGHELIVNMFLDKVNKYIPSPVQDAHLILTVTQCVRMFVLFYTKLSLFEHTRMFVRSVGCY